MEERNFYTLQKLFQRVLEKNIKVATQPLELPLCSKIWNTFIKWCRNQFEQERILIIGNTFQVSTRVSPDDLERIVLLGLTDQFLMKNGLMMNGNLDLTYPIIKTSFATLAKSAEVDRTVYEAVFDAIFEQIKNAIIRSKEATIDLGLMGKLKIKDRKIDFLPIEKQKMTPSMIKSKITVRGLLDREEKPKRLPKLEGESKLKPIEGALERNKNRLGQTNNKETFFQGNTLSLVSKITHTFREANEQVEEEYHDSPTRRYKTHKIGIKKEMLGAGIDPLNKEQDFSILAKSGKNLMNAHFIKPAAVKPRFPPVLNVFSRTLASPICSSPFPLPLPHRIGSNLSQRCIGLYIHQQKKCLMFQSTFLHSFEANEEFFKSIATEKQEVDYGTMYILDEDSEKAVSPLSYKDKKELESKILRKKQMYERYSIYLNSEIDSACVADIKAFWTDNIITKVLEFTQIKEFEEDLEDFVPLDSDTINEIIQENIDIMVYDYDFAMKKSILDYVLLDSNEKKRLGINYVHKETPFWGTEPIKSICADHEWRESLSSHKQTILEQLVICSASTWAILHSWQIQFKGKCKLLQLPKKGDRRVSLSQFYKLQVENMNKVKNIFIGQFCKNVLVIYEKEIAAFESNEYYIKKFCEANATLLSNILRDLIYDTFNEYVEFIRRFDTKSLKPVKEIMNGEINNPTSYEFEDAFLIVKVVSAASGDSTITLSDSTQSIKETLLKILDDLIKVSQQVSRPETQLRKVEKQTLPELTTEDAKYKESFNSLNPLLTKLLEPLDSLIGDLDPYLQYFNLNLSNYLRQPPTTKTMKEQLALIEQMNQHIAELPYFSCARVAELDFRLIKQTLENEVQQYKRSILGCVYNNLIKSSEDLSKNITNTFQYIKTKPETTEKLIQIEQEIMKIRKETERKYKSDYEDIRKWLNYLYSIDYKFTTDDYIIIYKSALLLFSLPQKVNEEEARIEDEKIRLEETVSQTRTQLHNQITFLIKNIDKLRQFNDQYQQRQANETIDSAQEKIVELTDLIQKMNKDQELLQLSSITEFPKLEEAQNMLKPYEDLWRLARNFDNHNSVWSKTPVFKLDPEGMKREVKGMANIINKLSYTFSKEKPEKGKKIVPLTGPAKMIEWLNQQVKEYGKNIPIVEVFSNPGMKERHWKELSLIIKSQISPEQPSKLNSIVSKQQVFDNLEKLEQISQNATKQYTMEKGLNKMYDDWAGVEVELKRWKDTGTHIVSGGSIDEIQQILDDHIVKTQMIKGDPFAKVFEEQIHDWEDWLNYTLEFSEFWVKVQSVWLYLEPIFSSPDILKHLPMEGAKFQQVDQKWREMMVEIVGEPKVLDFTKKRVFLASLKQCHDILEIVQKGLNAYLQGKRSSFPRFYFLSNDELLEILSETKDPTRVQPHLKKCFEGIQKLKFDETNKVLGMYSSEGEYVNFVSTVDTNAANGNVDMWLLWTETSMIESVKDVTVKAFQDYTKIRRDQWVRRRCGMAVLCISMTFWTTNSQAAIEAGPESLEEFSNKLTSELQEIVNVVRKDISSLDRCTIQALIVLDVHNRDMIAQLKSQGIEKTSEFAWQSQLRYYWEANDVWVRIINAKLEYNYEYLGNSSRLVITPLTDRCYRTLCGALNLNYGGAPEGPAGTGKTETVKDLAKALARQCVVFNCSDGLDYKAMGKFFKGLASSGAWSCFDEFNRIDLEVLSVVAQQILTITLARAKGLERFFFEDCDIPLKKTANCFITMNPGYAGRSQLPDNLKALFRAVAMMVPDYAMIAEISLYSFGFSDARNLARKIVTTYKLCSEQLSSQDHYDYGMRAVKSVLTAAGNLKRKFVTQNESILMLRAINDVNLAKFLAFDLPLFKGITSDLFPGVQLPEIDYQNMKQCIDEKLRENNLEKTDYVVEKIIQLYQMVLVRHGLMVVGLPFSGKSSSIKILAGALTLLSERKQMGENKTQLTILNPKSITMKQLYGYNDEISHEWTDGVLAVKFRAFAKAEDSDRKWLIFDGPVDAVWIENMNTVLDDNKKLCLNSGEIIAMSKSMNLMFEPMDLQAASPATVSRCGMVYMEPGSMGWKILYYSWQNKLPAYFSQEDKQLIEGLFMWLIDPILQFIRSSLSEISPTQDQNLVQSLMRYYDILLREAIPNEQEYNKLDAKIKVAIIEGKFAFSYIWSMGGSATTDNRKVIEVYMKKLMSGDIKIPDFEKRRLFLPDRGSLFDYNYVPRKSMPGYEWCLWIDFIDPGEKIPPKTQTQEIIVKTNDTIRYSYLLEINLRSENPSLFCGPTGTGKSCYIKNYINSLPAASYVSIELGFSAQTSSIQTQDIIDSKVDRRRKGVFGPKTGKGIMFIDDLNMPAKEKYGAQPPIELLRQYIDQGGWYEHKDKDKPFRFLEGIVLVAAMGPPGGGRTFITPRLLRHLTLTSLTSFEDETLTRIFNTILHWYFTTNNFNPEVVKCETKIITSTLDLYKTAMIELLPTPLKSHYLFNLRDFARVIYGICMVDRQKLSSQDQCARIWMHEILRVFGDRLVNEEDRLFLFNLSKELINKVWMVNFDKVFEHLDLAVDGKKDGKVDSLQQIRGLLWTDCMTPLGASKRQYQQVLDNSKLEAAIEEQLANYNSLTDKPMDLVMFSFAIEHLLIITRILKQPSGNALLVGVGGSGRQSLTRLAAKISDYEIFQIEISKTYGKIEWKEDLKKILKQSGGKNIPTVFLFTDSQIKDESFIEDINNLLNTYEVPNLFPTDEKNELMEMCRPIAKAQNKLKEGTPAQLYSFFVEKCKKNLHVVLCFSPIGDAFRTRVRMFPSLVNCCTIDWFQQWPQDGLLWVARRFLNTLQMDEEIREKCVQMVQYFHESTSRWARQFSKKLKRKYYVTPTSYIQLITTFKNLLTEKRKEVMQNINKYENGYEKIINTEKSVEQMQINLTELQPKLKEAAYQTEIKMKEVAEKKGQADILKGTIQEEEAVTQQAVDEANLIKSECQRELEEALPALRAAEDALKVLDRKKIDLLRTMKSPPSVIKLVMKALCIVKYPNPKETVKNPDTLKIEVDWWAASMKLLNNPKLLDELLSFDIENAQENIISNLGKFLKDPANEPQLQLDVVENASTACKCIIMWLNGIHSFYYVNKKVVPKKKALAESQAKVKGLNAQLAQKQKLLKSANDKVAALNDQLESTIRYKEELEKEYDDCSKQLVRAVQLIENLGGEKGRWGELGKELRQFYECLTGDILVSAGLIAYLGAFTSAFRGEITTEWASQCKSKQIPSSQTFNLQNTLGDPVKIREWNIDGLPSDDFSIENAIIIFKSRRWPLCIDPQGQANKWIKKMENKNKLFVIKLSDSDFLRTLENAIQFGRPVLLENVGEQLDPALEPILLKQTFFKGTTQYIKLGDQVIEYSSTFRFYITTKFRNPHYLPEISTKVAIINFMITYEGLNDQLLGILVKKERPDLEEQKQRLILEGASNKKELFEIQQKILQVLSSEKNILKDEEAIDILTASKTKSNEIKEKQEIAEITEKNIDAARQEYKPVSQEAACLFFSISDLANIDPMYQYSLTYYIDLFTQSILKSEKSGNLMIRLKHLRNYFLYSLYSNICRSLFQKDKLLFSFLLCVRLSEFKETITSEQTRFLLTGGVALDDYLPQKPQNTDWLSIKSWGEIYRLTKVEKFETLLDDIRNNVEGWKAIYDAAEPQAVPLPETSQNKYGMFEKLMILRTIRPDKLIPAVQDYVTDELGAKFITPPSFDLAKIYSDSSSTTPLIFILSPGSDPFASLNSFAQQKKKKISSISLGQGQGPLAQRMINDGQKNGDWVVLQNCHLAVTWMPVLEKICQQFNPDPTVLHPEFRLWLTSYPSDKFPTAILQNGVKMTNQPPKGLKANLTGSYLTDPISNQQFFEGNVVQPSNFKTLIYSLTFFHAVIQERRKYGPLGWNIGYEFNQSDLRISVRQLKMFLDQGTKIPFAALKYLTAECNYGGRVTDDKDRRLITTLLNDYFNEDVLANEEYSFSPDPAFAIPRVNTKQEYIEHIKSLPHLIHPNVFGFHANADITKDINQTNLLLESLLLCSSQSEQSKGLSQEQILAKLVNTILADFPKQYDLGQIVKKYPVEYTESMNTVLTQELTRFNGLIAIVRSSLSDIGLALVGKIIMSTSLEAASKSLFNGKVPDMWMAKSYPSLKPLSSYITDLKARLAFFQKWIDQGPPVVFWISGFFFTQSFLTGVLQNFARKYTIPIDQIVFDFEFMSIQPYTKPQDGAYVEGLFIEGAKWNTESMELDESDPKVLFVKCPVILLKPSHSSKLSNYKHYNCPVYKTSARRGVLSTTGHSTNFVMMIRLPTSQEEKHWIKRGVALLTQLDD